MATRQRRPAAIDPLGGQAGPPGGANDILSSINGAPPADSAPGSDPFAGFGGQSPAGGIGKTISEAVAANPIPATPPPFDPFALPNELPKATAVQGLDGLRGPISAAAIERTVGGAATDPIIASALQDIQAKLGELHKLHNVVSELIVLVNTSARTLVDVEKQLTKVVAQAATNGEGISALHHIATQLQAVPTQHHNASNGAVALHPPQNAAVTRANAIVAAIKDAVLKKRAAVEGFSFDWSTNPQGYFEAFSNICNAAGVTGASVDEIKDALQAGGHLGAHDLIF
jgi:hypothetical protein